MVLSEVGWQCGGIKAFSNCHNILGDNSIKCLEPISKSSEEDNEAGELHESEEVLGVKLPADQDAALPLDPRKEAFDEPTTHVAA